MEQLRPPGHAPHSVNPHQLRQQVVHLDLSLPHFSFDRAAPSQPATSSGQHRRIPLQQLVTADSNTATFECSICGCIAWQPKVTTCCSTLFCGMCVDIWMQSSPACPSCHMSLMEDGSTGGCIEDRVKALDRNSHGVQAVLWRVYGNLRVNCPHACGWNGNLIQYNDHLAICRIETALLAKQQPHSPAQLRQAAPSRAAAPEAAPAVVPIVQLADAHAAVASLPDEVVVVIDHIPTDDSQMPLRVGERVQVQNRAANGWVFGQRVVPSPNGCKNEGWFPSFCLPDRSVPRAQAAPPPKSPPQDTTEVTREYKATDPSQLSVVTGEHVKVEKRDASGWTFVMRVDPRGHPHGYDTSSGWVPDWSLNYSC